jgi:VIT1/CCC1 family predicted Fe2+/Mn2+ transporter
MYKFSKCTVSVAVLGLALFFVPLVALPTNLSAVPLVIIGSVTASVIYGVYIARRLGEPTKPSADEVTTLDEIHT